MKKVLMIFMICIILVSQTACDYISEIEKKSIITACVAIEDKDTKYGFYISVPSGAEGGEEEGSKTSAKYYEFKSDNFKKALDSFKESVSDDVDTSHMTLFAANDAYYRNKFSDDEKHISQTISTSALVDVCMIICSENELFECISSEYDAKTSDFAESILTDFEMNLSKLSLAVHNKNYTAKIPAVSLRECGDAKLPEVCSVSYYNSENGFETLPIKDFKLLKSKKYLEDDSLYGIDIKADKCTVSLADQSAADIASKYADKNIDILNVRHRGKKEFLYYDDYIKYFNTHNLNSINFVGEKE